MGFSGDYELHRLLGNSVPDVKSLLGDAEEGSSAFTQTPEEFVGIELLKIIDGDQQDPYQRPPGRLDAVDGGSGSCQPWLFQGLLTYWDSTAIRVNSHQRAESTTAAAAAAAEEEEEAALNEPSKVEAAAAAAVDTSDLVLTAAKETSDAKPKTKQVRAEQAEGAAPVAAATTEGEVPTGPTSSETAARVAGTGGATTVGRADKGRSGADASDHDLSLRKLANDVKSSRKSEKATGSRSRRRRRRRGGSGG